MRRLGCILALTLLAGCAEPGKTWRFAIEEVPGSVQWAFAKRFEARIEAELTDVDVRVYPYGALGTSDQTTEQLYNGTLQLATASPGHIGKLIPEVQAFLLHFLLSDDDDVNQRVLASDEVRALFGPMYAEKGMRLLSVLPEGWMVWTTQEKVATPADFEGVKIRVMTSPLLLEQYAAYGASPTPMPYAEVYSGLQLHMIDAQVNPVFAIEEMSFFEVTEWMIFPRAAPFVTTLIANMAFYEALPPERRKILDRVVRDLHAEIDQHQRKLERDRLAQIRERKPDMRLLTLDAEQRRAFAAAGEPARDRFIELAGPHGQQVLKALERMVKSSTTGAP